VGFGLGRAALFLLAPPTTLSAKLLSFYTGTDN
jgi:hypothetical protein